MAWAGDQLALTKQFALSKQTGCDAGNQNNDQARDNCEKLNSAKATVDLGLIKFKPVPDFGDPNCPGRPPPPPLFSLV